MELESRSVYPVTLELRQSGRVLAGAFRYNAVGTIARTGRVRKERFSSRAFRFAVNDPDREINLLVGHDFDKPLASKLRGSLTLDDGDDALRFEATLPEVSQRPTYMRDAVLMVESGLMADISPQFFLPPRNINPNAERLTPEPGNESVSIRDISDAVLVELSVVTRGVYRDSTEVSVRSEDQARAERLRKLKKKVMIWL